jgi:hypothetical protein
MAGSLPVARVSSLCGSWEPPQRASWARSAIRSRSRRCPGSHYGLRYLPKDKVKCKALSTYRLELGVSRSGRLIGGARAQTYHPIKAESVVPGHQTVYEVQQFTTEAT